MADSLTFLFWNLNKRPLIDKISLAVTEYDVNILILAESAISDEEFNMALPGFTEPESFVNKIRLFANIDPSRIVPVFDDPPKRLTIRRLTFPSHDDILLAAVHFYDRTHWSEYDQMFEAGNLARDIADTERRVGHSRTLLVGDLNMNPFDKAVVAAGGIHGVMARHIARRGSRVVASKDYPFFYNPMWALLGDRTSKPPGTHFYAQSIHIAYFWHMLDQVLVRPDLIDYLRDVVIIDSIGGVPLVNEWGKPSVSDHLPLLFSLHFP